MSTVRRFVVGEDEGTYVHATMKREGALVDADEIQMVVKEAKNRIQKAQNAAMARENRPRSAMDVADTFRRFGEAARRTLRSPSLAREIATALGDEGIVSKLRSLQVGEILRWEHVEEVCRISGGYQSHLLAPDQGARALIAEAVELARKPALEAVDDVYGALRKAIDQAAEQRLSKSHMPKADAAAAKVARECLEEWRADATALVHARIDMEKNYVSPAFFRRLARAKFEESDNMKEGWSIEANQSTLDLEKQIQTKLSLTSQTTGKDYLMGYLEKKVEGSKWQKRWFILDPKNRVLRYRKSPANKEVSSDDDVVIPLDNVKIERITSLDKHATEDTPREGARVFCKPLASGGPQCPPSKWIFTIQASDSSSAIVKGSTSLYLAAQSEGAMDAWVSGLTNAAKGEYCVKEGNIETPSNDAVLAPLISPRVGGYAYGPAATRLRTPRDVDSLQYGSSSLASKCNEGDYYTLKRVADEVSVYIGSTLSTLASAIPKAIAYCMLRPARKNLMDKLYTWACNMSQNGACGLQLLASESEEDTKEKLVLEEGIETLNSLIDALSNAKPGHAVIVPVEKLELLETFNPAPPKPRTLEDEEKEEYESAWDGMEMLSASASGDSDLLGVGVSMLAKTPSIFFASSLGG